MHIEKSFEEPESKETTEVSPESIDLSLSRFRLTPSSAVSLMKHSLLRHGQISPLIACRQESGALILVDGFKRQRAAIEAGIKRVRVKVLHLSGRMMKAHLYLCNRGKGFTYVEECMIISELHRLDGMNQVEIGDLLGRHKSWVCRRIQFIERISPYLLEDVRLNLLDPGSARKLARLPRCNQEEVSAIVKVHHLGSRDTARLVRLYLAAPTPEAKRYVITHPMDLLKQEIMQQKSIDWSADTGMYQVQKGFLLISTICNHLKRIMGRGAVQQESDIEVRVSEAYERAAVSLQQVHIVLKRFYKERRKLNGQETDTRPYTEAL
jgi:ParB-like chromosome segregation protein Spo0J